MKKILALSLLSAALLAPLKSQATGNCVLFWDGVPNFFKVGGSVHVVHSDGSGYTVNAQNFSVTNVYNIQNNSLVYVFRPSNSASCPQTQWGSLQFCVCNHQGSIDCGSPIVMNLDANALYEIYRGFAYCDCPNGQSGGGLLIDTVVHCNGGGGQ